MKFSIIIPTMNSEKYLTESINSIINQVYKNWEIIFVDKNSKDNTLKIITNFKNKFSNKIKLVLQSKGDLTNAFNLGIKNSSGDIISFLGSDDLYYNSRVFLELNSIFENKKTQLVFGNSKYINKKGIIFKNVNSRLLTLNLIYFHKVICHQSVFMKKDLFFKNGFFNEKYKYSADFEIIIKNLFNENYVYVNIYLAKFRFDRENISSKFWKEQLSEKRDIIIKYCPKRYLIFTLLYFKLIYFKKYILNLNIFKNRNQ